MAITRSLERVEQQSALPEVSEARRQIPLLGPALIPDGLEEDFETLLTDYAIDEMPPTASVYEWSRDGSEMEAPYAWLLYSAEANAREEDEARWAIERDALPLEVKIILGHIHRHSPEAHPNDPPGLPVRARIHKSIAKDRRIEENHFGPRGDLLLRSSLRQYELGVLGLSLRWWNWLTYKDKVRLKNKKFGSWTRRSSARAGNEGVHKRGPRGALQYRRAQGAEESKGGHGLTGESRSSEKNGKRARAVRRTRNKAPKHVDDSMDEFEG